KRAKEYISEGDIFQANLSQQFSAEFAGSAWDLYLNLKKINPSPFQGYINFGDVEVVSGSPERLVKVSSGRIETRPIAGTRRRGREPEDDKRLSEELILNEKERAEHLMLVDLERNDLGRVCKYGSVQVEEFMSLEAYSHVWHIVSGVAGSLKEGTTPMDILEACFPGGTITGCPKVRCMEIIEELEPVSRGVYTGSMGYFGWGGNIDLNILIRSAVIANGEIRFSTGAGIVADSDPASEHKETLSKAKAMMEALGSANVCY
ncbi:MAG: anthranilate synthase component I family protein, partial [Nitrospinota bacterium]